MTGGFRVPGCRVIRVHAKVPALSSLTGASGGLGRMGECLEATTPLTFHKLRNNLQPESA